MISGALTATSNGPFYMIDVEKLAIAGAFHMLNKEAQCESRPNQKSVTKNKEVPVKSIFNFVAWNFVTVFLDKDRPCHIKNLVS